MRKADLKGLEVERKTGKLIWEVQKLKGCSEEAEKRFGRKDTLIYHLHNFTE